VLAIPAKRVNRAIVTYLTEPEIDALLAAPDKTTWTGRRDHALLRLACQTGLRASELTNLTRGDAHLKTGAHISCLGKGRKERITPLTAVTAAVLTAWLAEWAADPTDPLFPHPPGNTAEQGRSGTTSRQTCRHRRRILPSTEKEESHPTRPASFSGDAPTGRRPSTPQ
jgi:integrase/recombinase XerD